MTTGSELLTNGLHPVEAEFTTAGWTVEYGHRRELIRVTDKRVLCADGRNRMPSPTLIGGLWGAMAMSREGGGHDIFAFRRVQQIAARAGLILGIHGDGHGPITGCGFFRLWSTGELKGKTYPFLLGESEVKSIQQQVPHILLPGHHEEKILNVNLLPGYTPHPNPHAFRWDAWVTNPLDIDPAGCARATRKTIELLSPVRRVRIIK